LAVDGRGQVTLRTDGKGQAVLAARKTAVGLRFSQMTVAFAKLLSIGFCGDLFL
jgi:hypothetical protein